METKPLETPVDALRSRDRQREDTKRRLFDAAMTVFRRDGVSESRIDDIVELAGVSRGSFYFHFPTKEDVLAVLLREASGRLGQTLASLAEDTSLGDVLQTVSSAIASEWENDGRIFPEVATVAMRLAANTPIADTHATLRSELARFFQKAADRGELMGGFPPDILSDVFLINQFTAAIAWSARPEYPLAAALKGIATLFLYGAHRNDS